MGVGCRVHARSHAVRLNLDLFYDYRTNVPLYPEWQRFLRDRQPRTIIFWGQKDIFFTPEGGEAYLAIKPSLARWKLVDRIRETNARIEKLIAGGEGLEYVDIFQPMLGADGLPRRELFRDDGLHLNAEGYKLWAKVLRPTLEE